MELRGLRRHGEVLAAVLVLEGAALVELKRASALAAMMADRCILVAVDGGLRTCRRAKRRPDLFVGDGDSAAAEATAEPPAVRYPQDKDFSDFAGALVEMRRRKVQLVFVAGLLGGRLDHEWANLLELASRSRPFAGVLAPTDRGTLVITSHGCRAATVRGRTCSIFSLSASSTVTLLGTQWELHRRCVRPGSHGLSNRTGTEIDLTVHRGVVALMLLPPRRGRGRRANVPAAHGGRSGS